MEINQLVITPQVFWLTDWQGNCEGGFYVRNNLKEFFMKLEADGKRVVGIQYDGSYNLQILVEKQYDENDLINDIF